MSFVWFLSFVHKNFFDFILFLINFISLCQESKILNLIINFLINLIYVIPEYSNNPTEIICIQTYPYSINLIN